MASAAAAVNHLLSRTAGTFPGQRESVLLMTRSLCGCTLNSRKMTSHRKTDHLERTANNFRQEILSQATVCGIVVESDTVKRLRLAVRNKDFNFKAGQWVDFFVPGVPKVGGFSICSTPGLLKREGVLELAVKYSKHPPAHWVHTECTLDSEVALRVGGDFYFDPVPSEPEVELLLVAGGVGINPLYAILLHVADLHRLRASQGWGYKPGAVQLCYCAKNTQELLFKNTIIGVAQEFPGKIACDLYVTQQDTEIGEELGPYITEGRISEEVLEKHISDNSLCYICGPPPMIESISGQLEHLGVSKERILFEKWW